MFYSKFKKMKKLLVSVPAIFLVLFLLYSFVLKGKEAANKSGLVNIVFKSTDGGQTWQDISKGLPKNLQEAENLQKDRIRRDSFFANDKGLFLKVGNELYHNAPNTTAPFWTKEIFRDEYSSIAPGTTYSYWGANLKKTNGTNVWSPIFEVYHRPGIRTAYETAGGTVFITTDRGFFKTTDNGKTWKHVHNGALAGHLAESDGVLVAISNKRIIRSTDNGENWAPVISEDSMAFDVKPIKGGFVAITSNSESNTPNTSRLSTSYDGGKTWQIIDAGPQNKVFSDSIMRTWNNRQYLQRFNTSIIQVGETFFCTHRNGIFKSSDKGKTWKLLLPSVTDKGFGIFISGDVIYAIRSKGGC
jgi:photosystem II stability/assembly factor-like uncharacterized protein